MKPYPAYLFFLVFIPFFMGCEKQPQLFEESDGLYFGTASPNFYYSFAKFPRKLIDTIQIPINVFGNAAGTERAISIENIKSAEFEAVEGVHFKLLSDVKIPANAFKATVPVAVYRTPELETKGLKFKLAINKNAAFPGTGITSQQEVTVNLTYIQQPASWGTLTGNPFAGYSANFGSWTKTKYKLILDALYDPLTGTTVTEFPEGNRFTGQHPVAYDHYVAIVRNYIRLNYPGNYGGVGASIKDPDANNQPVQVGPSNY
ncbi:DUF4843 domain-containing protein [Pedobacter gandavensis]|uniref:DUF4843 domain-containing protein n=1 Tax=Pedobacter gandavensis TaxID=2679963 RepID=A0ABR6ESJ2_9SPHI|nr:DUF4843 domain-containing protein [Pedobacter gandavensis]MBB2147388.1 DUF4843 domain-containing protein [Pedobacter gandavensis]